jgi:hypothetical protein
MILKDILSISGEPGLFKFIAQGKNAIIVEHLETNKRSSAHGSAKVSSLDDIAIFTEKEDIPLAKVFNLIFEKENSLPVPDSKGDINTLKNWFEGVLPEYSKDKVYTSDIRKVANWYNILHRLNLLVKEEASVSSDTENVSSADEKEKNSTSETKKE